MNKKHQQQEKLKSLRPHVAYLDVVIDDVEFEMDFPVYNYRLVRRKENLSKSNHIVCIAFSDSLSTIGWCVNSANDGFNRKKAYNLATGRFLQAHKHEVLANGPEVFGNYSFRGLSEKIVTFLQTEWKF